MASKLSTSVGESIKNLSNSKDCIRIEEDSTGRYLIKIFINEEIGRRSVLKQQSFSTISGASWMLSTPKIYKAESVDEGYRVVMDYIDGYSGYDMERIDTTQMVASLKQSLSCLIASYFDESVEKKIPCQVFLDKFTSIKNLSANTTPISNDFLVLLDKFIRSQDDWIVPIGNNHGDLTFTNIISTSANSFYLIDFLPSFLESPLWDIAKLEQDLTYNWSSRRLSGPQYMNLKIMNDSIRPFLLDPIKQYYGKTYKLFLAFCLIRILPYVKDDATQNWLDSSLQNLKMSILPSLD